MTDHVLCNSRLGNDDAEHLQFAVNSRRTPANVVSRHRSDKFSYPGIDGWASAPVAKRLPGPIQPKALAVPAHQGIRFENLECLQTARPQPVEPNPEQTLTPVESESFTRRLVYHGQLLAKREDFEVQEGAALKAGEKRGEKRK